jgi:prophage antirepressor-like protein
MSYIYTIRHHIRHHNMEIIKAFTTNKLHANIVIKGTHENPLFRASDIGEILEISNIRQYILSFDSTERNDIYLTDIIGRKQQSVFLTEKGLYKLLFKSRKPIADTFQTWLCEIIKELRMKETLSPMPLEATSLLRSEAKETRDASTQTEYIGHELVVTPTDVILYVTNTGPVTNTIIECPTTDTNIRNTSTNFDKFIQDQCTVHPDAQVSAKDIVGQYRLHIREARKDITQAFTEYLKQRFVYGRLKQQDADQVVLGYSGVTLNTLTYTKSPSPSEVETFVFERCIFTPSGTVLYKDIWSEYLDWKRILGQPWSESDDQGPLKQFLKQSPYLLFETVWATGGGGQGFYGLKLKRDANHHRTSSTGCAIVKKAVANDCILMEYQTIAKAAETESMCGAKMSRSVKNKTIFGDGPNSYYYCKK